MTITALLVGVVALAVGLTFGYWVGLRHGAALAYDDAGKRLTDLLAELGEHTGTS